jgi:hypothetical protein
MNQSTLAALLLATPCVHELLPLADRLLPLLQQLAQLLQQFRSQPLTPLATDAFERAVLDHTRELGRTLLEGTFNSLEPADPNQAPARLTVAGTTYRRRGRHPNSIATLCGPVQLQRLLYEPCERGEKAIHPLEQRLGVVAGCATPALAGRVGQWAAQQPQRTVLAVLRRDHGVRWSQETLRKVAAGLRDSLEPQRHSAQCQRVLDWLRRAQASRGRHRPVLAVGRDGVNVPLRRGAYREGAVATLSVFDRQGRRLGTVYLGRMPEEQQTTLSAQLTALLTEVLRAWDGPWPRLAYITDGGWHPTDYYRRVLRPMNDPRQPEQRLPWVRIIDFYHATLYLTQLAEALFGAGRKAHAWARRMRKRLQGGCGVTRVLQSAAGHRQQRKLSAKAAQAYTQAYAYLQKRRRFLDYSRYRREGLPLGSGVTEAACKTVFTQRLKQSGMGWEIAGGQVIVDLRVIWLSGLWDEVQQAALKAQTAALEGSGLGCINQKPKKTA